MSLRDDTIGSIAAGSHIGQTDRGMVSAAVRIATLLDDLLDAGDVDGLAKLLPRYIQVMVELQLSPASKQQGKLEEGRDGSDHIAGYLRLVEPKAGKSPAGAAKRGPGGGKPRQ